VRIRGRPCLLWHTREYRVPDFFDQTAILGGFDERRLIVLTRVSELPCIFGQRHDSIKERTQTFIDRRASLTQFFKTVRLSKRNVVPRQERFEAFFNRLLTVKENVSQQRWLRGHPVFRRPS